MIEIEDPTKRYAVPEDRRAWPADPLVRELSIAAKAIGIEDAALAAALADGQTIAQVAIGQGVTPHRVVVALVSDAVAQVAAQVQHGDLASRGTDHQHIPAGAGAGDAMTSGLITRLGRGEGRGYALRHTWPLKLVAGRPMPHRAAGS